MKRKEVEEKFEDWHKTEYDEDPDTKPHRFKKLPVRYEVGFLAKLDKRTEVFALLKNAFDEITNDMGGIESLSHIKVCLAERFTFLEYVLRGLERDIANNPKESSAILSRWIQALNSLTGLAKTIGLERRAKKINLKMYVESKQ
ncbi:MAG: hypothetical protein WAK60_00195 [Sedimentisphaerales bacterium]